MASDAPPFPRDFLWGTATSSHQVEGDNDGNDWAAWERLPGRIRDGSTCGRAAEWWRGRAEEDLRRAAALGQNAHRLGLEWSRLEPRPGRFDEEAFARYAAILEAARMAGLRTMVTLNHFTLPDWAGREGGWIQPMMPARLAAFTRHAARRLGPLVDLWVTLNEPNVLAYMAYAGTRWPPGLGRPHLGFRALALLLRGHAAASRALREELPSPSVGLALNLPCFDPSRPGHPLDRAVTAAHRWAFNQVLLRALADGWLRPPLGLVADHVPGLRDSVDWLGLNYYGRYEVRFDVHAHEPPLARHVQTPTVRTEWTDWGEPSPGGLRRQLLALARLGLPLYVTENGIYDNDDSQRPAFLTDHVRAVHDAIGRGADVRGYFHWSLVDNFEWTEGWSTRFGLLALDRDTQARTPRPSADLYARICRTNGASLFES